MAGPAQPRGGLEGIAALVTGGGSGIGLGCARRLAADGAHVTLCGRSEARLAAGAREIESAAPGARVQWIGCDVTNEEAVRAAVARAAEPLGGLHAVVAAAGGSDTMGPLATTALDAWQRVLALNATGTFLALKHAAPALARSGGGSFVAISSIAGHLTHRYFGPYPVGKAAIEALVRNAADELGGAGIRVNAIRPGLVATGPVEVITRGGPVLDDYLDQMPIRRVGTVEDVAGLARYLVGPESSWVTGQLIGVDGGHSLRRGPDFSPLLAPVFGTRFLPEDEG